MAWRRPVVPPRVEPPLWYRVFCAADWDAPDPQEQTMINGHCGYGEWPAELHAIHSERRWHEAKYRYRQEHPALAAQEFADLMDENRRYWDEERQRYRR